MKLLQRANRTGADNREYCCSAIGKIGGLRGRITTNITELQILPLISIFGNYDFTACTRWNILKSFCAIMKHSIPLAITAYRC